VVNAAVTEDARREAALSAATLSQRDKGEAQFAKD
jgi:hypothetical protein